MDRQMLKFLIVCLCVGVGMRREEYLSHRTQLRGDIKNI